MVLFYLCRLIKEVNMPYIGTFETKNSDWFKLEDLIKESKPDFAFDVNKKYTIQVIKDVRTLESDVEPTAADAGFYIDDLEKFKYEPIAGYSLYVKSHTWDNRITVGE